MADTAKLLENRIRALEGASRKLGQDVSGLSNVVGLISDGPMRGGIGLLNSGALGGAGVVAGLAFATTLTMANQYLAHTAESINIQNQSLDANNLANLRSQQGQFKTSADLSALSLEAARDRMTTAQVNNFASNSMTDWDKLSDSLGFSNNQAAKALEYKKNILSRREIGRMMGKTEAMIDADLAADNAAPVTTADITNASEEYLKGNYFGLAVLGIQDVLIHAGVGDVDDKQVVAKRTMKLLNPKMSEADVNAAMDALAIAHKDSRLTAERQASMKMIDKQNAEGSSRATKTLVGMREVLETRKNDWVDRQFFVRIEPEHRD